MDEEPRLGDLLPEPRADATITDDQSQTAADRAEGQGHETLAPRFTWRSVTPRLEPPVGVGFATAIRNGRSAYIVSHSPVHHPTVLL